MLTAFLVGNRFSQYRTDHDGLAATRFPQATRRNKAASVAFPTGSRATAPVLPTYPLLLSHALEF